MNENELKRLLKPILRGRDIKRYGYEWAGLWIIVVKFGFNAELDKYPAILEHLTQYKEQLKNRGQCRYSRGGIGQGQHHWLELDNNPKDFYLDEFEKEKIVFKAIGKNLAFSIVKSGIFVSAPSSFLTSQKNKYILGILSSKVVQSYIYDNSDRTGAGDVMLNIQSFEKIPLPKISQEEQEPFVKLVDEIMELKAKNEDTKEFENQIDEMVYKLYGLSEDEVKIINGK